MKLHSELNKEQYPEITVGIREPVSDLSLMIMTNDYDIDAHVCKCRNMYACISFLHYAYQTDQSIELELGDSIQATSVSSGKVQARVKVCRTIEEASQILEPGDILVTIGTDIGWSPFFPILGGIVTELGGLISHGEFKFGKIAYDQS
jgi:hypothetical protein